MIVNLEIILFRNIENWALGHLPCFHPDRPIAHPARRPRDPCSREPNLACKYLIIVYLSRIIRCRIDESPCYSAFTGVGAVAVSRAARHSDGHGRGSRQPGAVAVDHRHQRLVEAMASRSHAAARRPRSRDNAVNRWKSRSSSDPGRRCRPIGSCRSPRHADPASAPAHRTDRGER